MCGTFLPFWAISTSAQHFYNFKQFLQVCPIFIISSHVEPLFQLRHIFIVSSIFTSAPHFYHFEQILQARHIFTTYDCPNFLCFKPTLRVRHNCTIFGLFYEPFLRARHIFPFLAILTRAPHFYNFHPFLRVRHIFTILSHFHECTTLLPF